MVAESALIRHQLLILNRGRKRAPNLRATDRVAAGWFTPSMSPARIFRSDIILKPSTLLHLHNVLRKQKYRLLFSPQRGRRPGPQGPNQELIDAVVAMKRRNPSGGCPRIAQQIALAFGVEIDKDAVRRILSAPYRPGPDSAGPSWLTFLGQNEGQFVELRSVPMRIRHLENPLDPRCDGPIHASHPWVWRPQRCRGRTGAVLPFHRAIRGQGRPKYLRSDHDPLCRFHQWKANLRVLEVTQIQTVPYVPLSHPFVERLMGTLRREYLHRTLFWTRRRSGCQTKRVPTAL